MRDKTYLTSSEVAERLAVSSTTVGRWAREGRLGYCKTLGGHRRFDLEQVDQLEQALTVPVNRDDGS
jgi:excisionase family DNA binding protein